ncbi:VPLPA-CTERM sorting domain-containing protein [Roseospira navarrensis]|nr:VPLPA-CTERM sorting domain-containing protein [Roseospira navarrensis]
MFKYALPALVGAVALWGSTAQASFIDVHTGSLSDLRVIESAFWTNKTVAATEDFEGLAAGTDYSGGAVLNTAVGDFSSTKAGQRGQLISVEGTGAFHSKESWMGGRRNVTGDSLDGRYLENNDSKQVKWVFNNLTGINALSFFMTDVNDVSGVFKLTFKDNSTLEEGFTSSKQPNGTINFVTAAFGADVDLFEVIFDQSTSNDGWGADDFTVGAVPLPAAAWFLLTALGGLVGTRWLKKGDAGATA